jgi:Chromosome segregation ATPases
MPLFKKKSQLILITQYAPVNEKITQLYGKSFSIKVVRTLQEFKLFYAKQTKNASIIYDAIGVEGEELGDFLDEFEPKFNESFSLLLLESKLKEKDDYQFLDDLYDSYESEELSFIINLKKEKSFPSVADLVSRPLETMTKATFESYFPVVYKRRDDEKLDLEIDIQEVSNEAAVSPTSQEIGKDESKPVAMVAGTDLSHLLKEQLPSKQEEQKEALPISSTLPADKGIEEVEALKLENDELAHNAENNYQLALKSQKEAENLKQDVHNLKVQLQEKDQQIQNQQVLGITSEIPDFLTQLEVQQAKLTQIKESFDTNAVNEIERLKSALKSEQEERESLQHRFYEESNKVQDFKKQLERKESENQSLIYQLEETQAELKTNQAMVAQFQTFQAQFATLFNPVPTQATQQAPAQSQKANHAPQPKEKRLASQLSIKAQAAPPSNNQQGEPSNEK